MNVQALERTSPYEANSDKLMDDTLLARKVCINPPSPIGAIYENHNSKNIAKIFWNIGQQIGPGQQAYAQAKIENGHCPPDDQHRIAEGTAAAENKVGELRRDPFAMLPFCGYNMGDYFAHWLKMGTKTSPDKLPKIFFVNWFRKDQRGKFAWPGYGENSRVLKWIAERLDGKAEAQTTAIGLTPTKDSLDLSGLTISDEHLDLLLNIDLDVWFEELALVPQNYDRFGDRLPEELWAQHRALAERLHKARRGTFRVIKGEAAAQKSAPSAGMAAS